MTPAVLRTENRRLEARVSELEKQTGALVIELETTRREYQLKLDAAEAKLHDLVRRMFGRSSEKIDPKQHLLALECVQADQTIAETVQPEIAPVVEATPPKSRAKRGARRPIPANLPVERVVHDLPEDQKRDPNTGVNRGGYGSYLKLTL